MSDSKAPLVLETPGGLSVSYGGRLLYSGREPARLPSRIAANCDPGPARLHLVPSPLLWYGIGDLLKAMGEDSAVLCVEANPELASLARSRMPRELASDPRVGFLASSSLDEVVQFALSMGNFRACFLSPLSGGESLYPSLYRAMASSISSAFEAEWRNRAALMVLGPRWAKNIFDNIAALPEMAPSPLPRFDGATLVCGAGSSLEAALPLITSRRDKLRIVACDTALGTLLGSRIEPDLVVCLEGQAHNLSDFTCLGTRPIALAADLSSHPATFRCVRGPKHLSLVRITRSPFLDRLRAALAAAGTPFLDAPPLGSVGVHACHIARESSAGPILATGLDFSYEVGKSHARGCPSLLAEERRLGRLTRWPGQYEVSFRDRNVKVFEDAAGGEKGLISDPTLMSYACLLKSRFAEGLGKGEGSGLYDIRPGGPDIGGRRLSLDEAARLLDGSVRTSIDRPEKNAPERGERNREAARRVALDILGDEKRRLGRLCASMHGREKLESGAFRALVLESDYLWWGFPDQERAQAIPQDFLNRLVPQAEWWSMRLEALEESLK
jgi:hypothetical protein